MSDEVVTPLGTARVNSERFDSELDAVWFAANYYYGSSLNKRAEYCGVVFSDSGDQKFGITVHTDGLSDRSSLVPDAPEGTKIVAIWHTHLPPSQAGEHPSLNYLYSVVFKATTGSAMEEEFTPNDRNLSESWSTKFARPIPIYLVTATTIKRFRSRTHRETIWKKSAPSKLK